MKRNKKTIIYTLGSFFTILILTVLRENFFLEINTVMQGKEVNQSYFFYLQDYFIQNAQHLLKLKWAFTFIFSILISLLTVLAVHNWYNKKEITKLVVQLYAFAFTFLVLFGLTIFLCGYFNEYYFILRKVFGFIQSPLPLFLFFVTFYNKGELK